ncbi:NADH-quinone oxidoreductase subunit M [Tahibacter amnicola]|uniref:NADH-quinone oxidoreductase subunit M n=1 Tax=Tahibacter amnicola TaxID=2976241 RepID=A0ABY6BIA5_9GAMM|nr:NADH-quinone oxidoreductase subunit M [Tahibacter amnicola]UXI69739.1 NADH-quinone oxidoreductase subunit M [Tahibacter amnicola]
MSLLSLLIWLPFIGAVPVLLAGEKRPDMARWITLLVALVTFAASLLMLSRFDSASAAMQLQEKFVWIEALQVNYHLGVDGISVALVLLTTFTSVLVVLGAWGSIDEKVNQYMAAMLVLEGLMVGVFCAMDALLFYVFFEGMLIPMFILIGVWGGARRVYATLKFFIYTFFGSIFMLIGLIYLYFKAGTFDLATLASVSLSAKEQAWLFFAFLLAFAVKVPMWPVHTWLPDAHVEAPTGGSVVLAAIMLKIGGYGFIRFSLPITPDASAEYAWIVIAMSLIAVVYVGYVALVQEDMKKLIAYSSIAHMGFVTLGVFIAMALTRDLNNANAARIGLQGAMIQMISHGFISGAMFSCVGVLYDRMHTRMIKDYGGVVNTMPKFAALFVLFAMANCGLPGTSGFVGEFWVILAAFQSNPWVAALAAFTLIIGAAYTLWLVKRVIFGEVANENVAQLEDINAREFFVLAAFAGAVLLFGLWPKPLGDLMDAPIKQLVDQILVSKGV